MINNLQEISFVNKSTTEIEQAVITTYESISEKKLYPGDPVRLFLESVSLIIAQQRVLIDYSAKQNLLAYASGDFLDHIGALLNCTRLQSAAAQTTLRFALSAPQNNTVIIPAGVRATAGNNIDFATTKSAAVAAGELFVDVAAQCTQVGSKGNGLLAGQISIIVDPQPWLQSVVNTTITQGGADVESDVAYRERINIAPERFSTAGPQGAYEYWAKTAHQDIIDVAVYSPTAGCVNIIPLLKDGQIPDADILQLVDDVCNDISIRPLTDNVQIIKPTVLPYDIKLTYYIKRSQSTLSLAIQQAVNKAVQEFVLWQKSKLGRDINVSELTAKLISAGCKRVVIDSPIFTRLELDKVAVADNVELIYGGIEDE